MTTHKSIWDYQIVKRVENWIDRRSRFTAALAITTILLTILASALGLLCVFGFILFTLFGVSGIFISIIFLLFFIPIYGSLKETS